MAGVNRYERAEKLVKDFCVKLGWESGNVAVYGGAGGVGDVCKGVAESVGAKELLGTTEAVQGEVATWVGVADAVGDGKDVDVKLQELNAHLETRSVVAGNGMEITVADLSMFAAVHEVVDEKRHAELEKVPHILRWIDYIQSKQSAYPIIPVSKPKFNPPKPAARAAKPVKESSAEDAASAVKPGKSTVEAAAPKVEKKKEKAPAVKKEMDTSFSVLDVRVGLVKKVWKHPGADALFVEEIDIGEASPRQIVSGLAKFLTEEELLNRKVLVLTNVKAGKVRDVLSSGLVLCASNSDHTQCEPVAPPSDAKVGEKVTVAGFEGAPEEVLNPKKKQFEKIQPDLTTDASGVACYQGIPFMLSGKPCTSSIVNAIVK